MEEEGPEGQKTIVGVQKYTLQKANYAYTHIFTNKKPLRYFYLLQIQSFIMNVLWIKIGTVFSLRPVSLQGLALCNPKAPQFLISQF